MQKLISILTAYFILTQSFAQSQNKVVTYLSAQYSKTLYDYTLGNNPWGVGAGLQTSLNNKTEFKPTIEFTADLYLEDDKVLRLNPDGSLPNNDNQIKGVINLFAGSSFHPTQSMYVSLIAGPSFINGNTYFGVKPSFGFYFSKTQRWTGKISYINVFNRIAIAKEDFGSLSFSIGLKLF